jgi:uncharacterized BrkB/YihY/UPF0761 family membrane protein
MKLRQDLQRLISNVWLAAAPLVILLMLLVGLPAIFAIVHAILAHMLGREAADTLSMDALMWTSELTLVLAPAGLLVYAAVAIARRLPRRKQP